MFTTRLASPIAAIAALTDELFVFEYLVFQFYCFFRNRISVYGRLFPNIELLSNLGKKMLQKTYIPKCNDSKSNYAKKKTIRNPRFSLRYRTNNSNNRLSNIYRGLTFQMYAKYTVTLYSFFNRSILK